MNLGEVLRLCTEWMEVGVVSSAFGLSTGSEGDIGLEEVECGHQSSHTLTSIDRIS